MELNSIFFISCFFTAVTLLYCLIGRASAARKALLIAAGLAFYAFGRLTWVLLLLAMAVQTWLFGLALMRGRGVKALKICAVTLNLAVLGGFKYLDFALGALSPLFGGGFRALGIAAPAGLSFFTFKCISYVLDTAKSPEKGTRSFAELLLYISFFPQLLAGPITRFETFGAHGAGLPPEPERIARGMRRFVIGLGKKLLIASAACRAVDAAFGLDPAALDARIAWAGAAAYLIQIYFDFSGYSDMAIGLGNIFGFETAENFDYPYISASITEFWRRWHISLSGWFRDYLYIPLGGNRRGRARAAANKFIVFTLCGLWHGAAWTFIVWGAWHGLLAALETLGVINVKKLGKSSAGRALGHVYTLLAVCLGFVFFRAGSLGEGARMVSAMFTGFSFTAGSAAALKTAFGGFNAVCLAAGALFSLPVGRKLAAAENTAPGQSLSYIACAALLAACIAALASGGFTPFIYSQF